MSLEAGPSEGTVELITQAAEYARADQSDDERRHQERAAQIWRLWGEHKGLTPGTEINDYALAAFAYERINGHWTPPQGKRLPALTTVRAQVVRIAKYHGTSIQSRPAAMVLRKAEQEIDASRLQAVPARAITLDLIDVVLDHLATLEENAGAISVEWLARTKALFLVAAASGLRADELARMQFSWETHSSAKAIELTVPFSKINPTPVPVTIAAAQEDPRRCPIAALRNWLELLAPHVENEPDPYIFAPCSKWSDHIPRTADWKMFQRKLEPDEPSEARDITCHRCELRFTTQVRPGDPKLARCPQCMIRNHSSRVTRASIVPYGAAYPAGFTIKTQEDIDLEEEETGKPTSATKRKMGARYVQHSLKALLIDAGIKPRSAAERVSAHGTRRGCATNMFNNGAFLAEISAQLGHTELSATPCYISGPDSVEDSALYALDAWADGNGHKT